MSQRNVEIVLEAFRRGEAEEFERLAELMDPEVTMGGLENWPEPGPFIGSDAVVAQLERLRADWAEQRFEDIRLVAENGEWEVVEYRWHARGASGLVADFDLALASRIKGGRIIDIQYRWDRKQALGAAGLSE